MRPDELVDRYLDAVTDRTAEPEQLERLLHAEFSFRGWPNAISPTGSERDRATSLGSIAARRTIIWRKESFDCYEPFDNSVKGRLVAGFLSTRLGLDLLISAPDSRVHG